MKTVNCHGLDVIQNWRNILSKNKYHLNIAIQIPKQVSFFKIFNWDHLLNTAKQADMIQG